MGVHMIYDDKKFIGSIIKKARKRAKLTQADLAEKIDMSEKNLGNIENGKQYPQINNFFRMAEILNLTLEDFGVDSKMDEYQKLIRDVMMRELMLTNPEDLAIYCEIIRLIVFLTDKRRK